MHLRRRVSKGPYSPRSWRPGPIVPITCAPTHVLALSKDVRPQLRNRITRLRRRSLRRDTVANRTDRSGAREGQRLLIFR